MNNPDINRLIWSIDDEEHILDYRLPNGLCYWLIYRHSLYRALLDSTIAPPAATGSFLSNVVLKLKNRWKYRQYLRSSFVHDPANIDGQFDCVNICSNVAMVPGTHGYRSRITGFLDDINSISTLHVINSVNQRFQKNYQGRFCFLDAILIKAGKLKQEVTEPQIRVIHSFIELLEKHAGKIATGQHQLILKQLIHIAAISSPLEQLLSQFFAKINPSLVIMEDGNYGGIIQNSVIRAARNNSIKTAEIQHGVFDLAFQYTDKLVGKAAFAPHKTDYVLTFGDYFTEFIHSSSKNRSIGSYYLEEKKKQVPAGNTAGATGVILFITQLDYTNEIIPVLQDTLQLSKKRFRLIIRIHPSDTGNREKYNGLPGLAETTFSVKEDLYSQLQAADYVIGSYSTALYESIYFDKIPFIHSNRLSNQLMPKQLGRWFATAEELCSLLQQPISRDQVDQAKKYFWKEGAVENFKRFLSGDVA